MKVEESWRFEIPFSSVASSSYLPTVHPKSLLPSSAFVFFGFSRFVLFAAALLCAQAHDDLPPDPAQMSLLHQVFRPRFA
jgi:hypothetical protein